MKAVRSSASSNGRLYPQECSRYSFSLGTESTPVPWYGRKEYVTEKSSETIGNRSRDRHEPQAPDVSHGYRKREACKMEGTDRLAKRQICPCERRESIMESIARAERDGTRAETRFRISPKRTSSFKSVGESVQSTAGSRGVRISLSNAG